MWGTVERRNRNTRDTFHHEALIDDGLQRLNNGWGLIQERFLTRRPELVHDDAVRHVHEGEPYGWFGEGGSRGQ